MTDFVIADAEQMQFPRAAFDLIWVMESSEHFSNRPRFFRRAAKALREGGALLLAAWSASDNAESQALERVAEAAICPVEASDELLDRGIHNADRQRIGCRRPRWGIQE